MNDGYCWGPLSFLRLAPGYSPLYGPFRMQMEAIATMIDNIFSQAGLSAPRSQHTLPRDLILRRRVYGRGGGMTNRRPVHILQSGGSLVPARKGDLQPGDLVEATASFDFEVLLDRDGLPRVSIFLAYEEVVRAQRGLDLQMMVRLFLSPLRM